MTNGSASLAIRFSDACNVAAVVVSIGKLAAAAKVFNSSKPAPNWRTKNENILLSIQLRVHIKEAGARTHLLRMEEDGDAKTQRSEEHTSELQSLMHIAYAVFCFKT